jgi:hypothetical protein
LFNIQPFHPDRSTSAAEGSSCNGFRVFKGKESSSFVIPCSIFDIQPLFNIRYSPLAAVKISTRLSTGSIVRR